MVGTADAALALAESVTVISLGLEVHTGTTTVGTLGTDGTDDDGNTDVMVDTHEYSKVNLFTFTMNTNGLR